MESMEFAGTNACFQRSGLQAGTTTTFSTTLTINCAVKGQVYSFAAVTNAATPTTDYNTGVAFKPVNPNQACVFVFCTDGVSGPLDLSTRVVQGPLVDLDGTNSGSAAGYVTALPPFPGIPDAVTPYGFIIVKVGAGGAAWTFGASNLAGPPANTGITYTACSSLPSRPRAS